MYYIAQIGGFTMEGNQIQIQQQWNELKERFSHLLIGDTLKFFKAEKSGDVFVVNCFTPVKEMVFNG